MPANPSSSAPSTSSSTPGSTIATPSHNRYSWHSGALGTRPKPTTDKNPHQRHLTPDRGRWSAAGLIAVGDCYERALVAADGQGSPAGTGNHGHTPPAALPPMPIASDGAAGAIRPGSPSSGERRPNAQYVGSRKQALCPPPGS